MEESREENLHNLLAAMVEQSRAMATRVSGDPERGTACHFCGDQVPLWESLLVMQLAGVPAHVSCPDDSLQKKLNEVGPDATFPYDDFSSAVDARCDRPWAESCAGQISKH